MVSTFRKSTRVARATPVTRGSGFVCKVPRRRRSWPKPVGDLRHVLSALRRLTESACSGRRHCKQQHHRRARQANGACRSALLRAPPAPFVSDDVRYARFDAAQPSPQRGTYASENYLDEFDAALQSHMAARVESDSVSDALRWINQHGSLLAVRRPFSQARC